jgi:hypothetical protein
MPAVEKAPVISDKRTHRFSKTVKPGAWAATLVSLSPWSLSVSGDVDRMPNSLVLPVEELRGNRLNEVRPKALKRMYEVTASAPYVMYDLVRERVMEIDLFLARIRFR